jgi:hypothetical protein
MEGSHVHKPVGYSLKEEEHKYYDLLSYTGWNINVRVMGVKKSI